MFSSQLASCLDIHYHNKRAKSRFLEEILFVSALAQANEQKECSYMQTFHFQDLLLHYYLEFQVFNTIKKFCLIFFCLI